MDPVTMSLLALQGISGAGKAIYGASQKARGKRALADAYVAPTGKPKEYAEMLAQARESDVRQRQLEEINKSMSTSTEALQRAGSRGVIGGIGAITEAGIKGRTGVLNEQQKDIMKALEFGAQGAESQRTRDIARANRERKEATAAITAGTENIVGGLSDIAKTAGVALDAKNSKSLQAQTDREKQERLAKLGFGSGGVQKTPGAFCHNANPIDIMKDGAKIGEMTGGEYIFNPSQAKKLKQLSSSGSSKLHKFVSSLLNKPQFK